MTAADSDALKALLAVQELDRSIDALRHQRLTLPAYAELEQLATDSASLEAGSVEVRDGRHVLERDQKRLEDEVALIEDRIRVEDAKLYGGTVKGVKDLQALQDEIASLKNRQGQLEDQILEVMEAAEPVDAELQVLATRQASLDEQASAARERLAADETALDAELETSEAERASTAAAVNDELLAEYDRIRAEPGRIGVARLVGSTCHGCHLELAAMEVDRLKKLPADALVHCDECGCILVR